jgi:hypothetical protein
LNKKLGKQTIKEIDLLLVSFYIEEAERVYNEVVRVRPTTKISFMDKICIERAIKEANKTIENDYNKYNHIK